jgi:hypothetical protein
MRRTDHVDVVKILGPALSSVGFFSQLCVMSSMSMRKLKHGAHRDDRNGEQADGAVDGPDCLSELTVKFGRGVHPVGWPDGAGGEHCYY